MLNTLLMSFSGRLAVLVALLFWFLWFQSRWRKDGTGLRELIANSGKGLLGEIADCGKELRKEITDRKDEPGKASDRVARMEGQLGSPPHSGNPRPRRKSE